MQAGKRPRMPAMLKVVLNGQVIHDNVEMKTATGSNWDKPEHPTGPFLLQSDHGPVAFRNVKIRPLHGAPKAARDWCNAGHAAIDCVFGEC